MFVLCGILKLGFCNNFLIVLFSLSEFMPQVKVEQVETVEGCSHEVLEQISKDI